MAFSFGSTTTTTPPTLFGSTATPVASTGFGGFGNSTGDLGSGLGPFGNATTNSSTWAGFGFGGFGTATTAPSSSVFGTLGATPTSASPLPFPFTAPNNSTSTGFGGFGTGTTGFGDGLASTGTVGTFDGFGGGSTFGVTDSSTLGVPSGTGFFGTPVVNCGQAPAAQPQNVQQQEEIDLTNVAMAVSLPQIYGDERDAIIAKWNQLQAYWGTGKGFYSASGVVEFKPENHLCRFKALGYHLIPKGSNELGHVALVLAHKEEEVAAAQQQVVDTVHRILGSQPTLSVCVEGIKPLPEDRTEIVIYILERPAQGPAKRVPANDLFNFLNQPTQKSQIATQLKVESMLPKVGWTEEQLKEYLDKPPAGIDPLLWQQAKLDNPDPEKYIPVPMIGFKELQRRLKHQAEQTKLFQQRLDVISGDIVHLKTRHCAMMAKLEDNKRKNLELGRRLLKVIVKQEIYRKMGFAIQAEEETLKVQLEQLKVELNHPTQFKGRLDELMSQMRTQLQMASGRAESTYQIDQETQAEVRLILKQQQDGIQHLIDIVKEDATDMQLIEQGVGKSRLK
ncbi:hypothetical protein BsWGS_08195 [Bradybaena similaris]